MGEFGGGALISETGLEDSAVTGIKLSNDSISTAKLQPGAVIESKLANNSVTEDKIAALSVGTTELQDGSVTTAKLQPVSVVESKLSALSVGTTKLQDGSVTKAKLAFGINSFISNFTYFSFSNQVAQGLGSAIDLTNLIPSSSGELIHSFNYTPISIDSYLQIEIGLNMKFEFGVPSNPSTVFAALLGINTESSMIGVSIAVAHSNLIDKHLTRYMYINSNYNHTDLNQLTFEIKIGGDAATVIWTSVCNPSEFDCGGTNDSFIKISEIEN